MFDRLIAVNLKGLLSCLRHEITKGGVNALTKAAAIEVAKDNISVNALAFAAIDIPGDMIWRFLDAKAYPRSNSSPSSPSGEWADPRSSSPPSAASAPTTPAT